MPCLQVGTDIILSQVYCDEEHPPHDVEVTEEWLRILSIAILSFFVIEWCVEVRFQIHLSCPQQLHDELP